MVLLKPLLAIAALQLASAAPQASVYASTVSSPSPLGTNQAVSLTTEETEELFSLHEELVNIPSISGDEVECAEFVSEYLTELGYYVEEVPVGDTGTYNVFAYPQELKDRGVWPEVLITSHIDTVSTAASPLHHTETCLNRNTRCHHFTHSNFGKKMAQPTILVGAPLTPKDQSQQ